MEKKKIHDQSLQIINEKISDLNASLHQLGTTNDTATKSSMGDKYETDKAMTDIEKERLSVQIDKNLQLLDILNRLDPSTSYSTAGMGALVKTDSGIFYLSIGLGPLQVENTSIFVISLASPIGQALKGHTKNDVVQCNGRSYKILDVA